MNKFSTPGRNKIVNGSILNPEYAGLRLILNFINLSGKTDSHMFELFDKKWRKVKEETKGWYASRNNFKLGEVTVVAVQSDTWVINCLCQEEDGKVNLNAITNCIKKVANLAVSEKASVHVHSSLLNEFSELNKMLNEKLIDNGINVSYYQEAMSPS